MKSVRTDQATDLRAAASLVHRRFKLLVCTFLVSVSVAIVVVDSQSVSARSDDGTEFFEKRIRPILIDQLRSLS